MHIHAHNTHREGIILNKWSVHVETHRCAELHVEWCKCTQHTTLLLVGLKCTYIVLTSYIQCTCHDHAYRISGSQVKTFTTLDKGIVVHVHYIL